MGWMDEKKKKKGRKGRPRFPKLESTTNNDNNKKKNPTLVPISRPPQLCRTMSGTLPALHSATLGSFSAYEKPMLYCMYLSLVMFCYTVNVEKGDDARGRDHSLKNKNKLPVRVENRHLWGNSIPPVPLGLISFSHYRRL